MSSIPPDSAPTPSSYSNPEPPTHFDRDESELNNEGMCLRLPSIEPPLVRDAYSTATNNSGFPSSTRSNPGLGEGMMTPSSSNSIETGKSAAVKSEDRAKEPFVPSSDIGKLAAEFWKDRNFRKLSDRSKLGVLDRLTKNADDPRAVENLQQIAGDRGFRKLSQEHQNQILNAWDRTPADPGTTDSLTTLANDRQFRRAHDSKKTQAIREVADAIPRAEKSVILPTPMPGSVPASGVSLPINELLPPRPSPTSPIELNSEPSPESNPEYWSIPELGRNTHVAHSSNGDEIRLSGLKGKDDYFGPGGMKVLQNDDGTKSIYSVDDRTNKMSVNRVDPEKGTSDEVNQLTLKVGGESIEKTQIEAMAFDGENFYVGQIGKGRPDSYEQTAEGNRPAINVYKVALSDVDQAIANGDSSVNAEQIRGYYPDRTDGVDAESLVWGKDSDGNPSLYVATKDEGKSSLYALPLGDASSNSSATRMENVGRLSEDLFGNNKKHKLTDIEAGPAGILATIDREDRRHREKHQQFFIPADPNQPGSVERALTQAEGLRDSPVAVNERNEATSWVHSRDENSSSTEEPNRVEVEPPKVESTPGMVTGTSTLPSADPDVLGRLHRSSESQDSAIAEVKAQLLDTMEREFGENLSRERRAMWMAELQTEQSIPSLTADGVPGGPSGRDASKDGRTDGAMNIGPWNDNVAMLSKYGGLSLPLKNGEEGIWGQKDSNGTTVSGSKVDWSKVKQRFTGEAGLNQLPQIMRAKNESMNRMGLDAYMAGRRGGLGVLNDDGNGSPTIDYTPKWDRRGREYWNKGVSDGWRAGHLFMANQHLENPGYMMDDIRRAFSFDHV